MALADAYSDPTVLAFLRSSGLANQTATNDVGRQTAAINQALGTNIANSNAQGAIDRRQIGGNMEANGVYRSGQMLQAEAEQAAAQARQQGAYQQTAANQIGDLQDNLAMSVAQNQQKAAEMGLAASSATDLASGKAAIDAKYGPSGSTTDSGIDPTTGTYTGSASGGVIGAGGTP